MQYEIMCTQMYPTVYEGILGYVRCVRMCTVYVGVL